MQRNHITMHRRKRGLLGGGGGVVVVGDGPTIKSKGRPHLQINFNAAAIRI